MQEDRHLQSRATDSFTKANIIEENRLMSIDLKNTKEKSLQPFLLPSSIMNLTKDYKNNRKNDNHTTESRERERSSLNILKIFKQSTV
jgi:hypothetical protein